MKRFALALLLALVACDDHSKSAATCLYHGATYAVGDVFPAGDGCNSCMCTATGADCTALTCADGGVDANPSSTSCLPSGGCPGGPVCGMLCCGSGEHCVNGACRCGSNAACSNGDTCEHPGPAGGDGCGTICCGVSGPCPASQDVAPGAAAP